MGGTPTAEAQANADAQDEQADEEETDDEDVLYRQKVMDKKVAETHARYMARLARLKIDRYRLVGEDSCW